MSGLDVCGSCGRQLIWRVVCSPSMASASEPCCGNWMPPPPPCLTHRQDRLQSPQFLAFLLRRLRLPLPLIHGSETPVSPTTWCLRRSPCCSRICALRSHGAPLERATARVCREAGATVAMHVLIRDLNVVPVRHDERGIEAIAKGLPLWGGVQLAVDTTRGSPFTAGGMPRGRTAGAALRVAERAKAWTYPELACRRRCRLVVLGFAVGRRLEFLCH